MRTTLVKEQSTIPADLIKVLAPVKVRSKQHKWCRHHNWRTERPDPKQIPPANPMPYHGVIIRKRIS